MGAPTSSARSTGGASDIVSFGMIGSVASCSLFGVRTLPLQLRPPRQAFGDLLLEPETPGLVEHRVAQFLGQILLRNVCLRGVVRVLVPLAVTQLLHQRRR